MTPARASSSASLGRAAAAVAGGAASADDGHARSRHRRRRRRPGTGPAVADRRRRARAGRPDRARSGRIRPTVGSQPSTRGRQPARTHRAAAGREPARRRPARGAGPRAGRIRRPMPSERFRSAAAAARTRPGRRRGPARWRSSRHALPRGSSAVEVDAGPAAALRAVRRRWLRRLDRPRPAGPVAPTPIMPPPLRGRSAPRRCARGVTSSHAGEVGDRARHPAARCSLRGDRWKRRPRCARTPSASAPNPRAGSSSPAGRSPLAHPLPAQLPPPGLADASRDRLARLDPVERGQRRPPRAASIVTHRSIRSRSGPDRRAR